MIPTRDNQETLSKKKALLTDDQYLVTSELVQVLYSKQTRIDELESRLKHVEQHESQWKVSQQAYSSDGCCCCYIYYIFQMKYERECNRCELLQTRVIELEQELLTRKHQSKILGQLQTDVKRLNTAFDALEVNHICSGNIRLFSIILRWKILN